MLCLLLLFSHSEIWGWGVQAHRRTHMDILLPVSIPFLGKSTLKYPRVGQIINPVRIYKPVEDHIMSPSTLLPGNKIRHGNEEKSPGSKSWQSGWQDLQDGLHWPTTHKSECLVCITYLDSEITQNSVVGRTHGSLWSMETEDPNYQS